MTSKRNANRKEQTKSTQPPALIAYHVAERGENSYWTRIGAAWDHEDAKGLTIQLDLVLVDAGRNFFTVVVDVRLVQTARSATVPQR